MAGLEWEGADSLNNDYLWYIWMVIVVINILIPASKLIVIYTEMESPEDGLFILNTKLGERNLEVEMYGDIVKIAVLAVDFLVFPTLNTIAKEIL